eukprot:Nk52_evm29s238 gene=Nk52_evmTU29s238
MTSSPLYRLVDLGLQQWAGERTTSSCSNDTWLFVGTDKGSVYVYDCIGGAFLYGSKECMGQIGEGVSCMACTPGGLLVVGGTHGHLLMMDWLSNVQEDLGNVETLNGERLGESIGFLRSESRQDGYSEIEDLALSPEFSLTTGSLFILCKDNLVLKRTRNKLFGFRDTVILKNSDIKKFQRSNSFVAGGSSFTTKHLSMSDADALNSSPGVARRNVASFPLSSQGQGPTVPDCSASSESVITNPFTGGPFQGRLVYDEPYLLFIAGSGVYVYHALKDRLLARVGVESLNKTAFGDGINSQQIEADISGMKDMAGSFVFSSHHVVYTEAFLIVKSFHFLFFCEHRFFTQEKVTESVPLRLIKSFKFSSPILCMSLLSKCCLLLVFESIPQTNVGSEGEEDANISFEYQVAFFDLNCMKLIDLLSIPKSQSRMVGIVAPSLYSSGQLEKEGYCESSMSKSLRLYSLAKILSGNQLPPAMAKIPNFNELSSDTIPTSSIGSAGSIWGSQTPSHKDSSMDHVILLFEHKAYSLRPLHNSEHAFWYIAKQRFADALVVCGKSAKVKESLEVAHESACVQWEQGHLYGGVQIWVESVLPYCAPSFWVALSDMLSSVDKLYLLEPFLPFSDRHLLPETTYTELLLSYLKSNAYITLLDCILRWPVVYNVSVLISAIASRSINVLIEACETKSMFECIFQCKIESFIKESRDSMEFNILGFVKGIAKYSVFLKEFSQSENLPKICNVTPLFFALYKLLDYSNCQLEACHILCGVYTLYKVRLSCPFSKYEVSKDACPPHFVLTGREEICDSDHVKLKYMKLCPPHPLSYAISHRIVEKIFGDYNFTNADGGELQVPSSSTSLVCSAVAEQFEVPICVRFYAACGYENPEDSNKFGYVLFSLLFRLDVQKILDLLAKSKISCASITRKLIKELILLPQNGCLVTLESCNADLKKGLQEPNGEWVADILLRLCQESPFFATKSVIEGLRDEPLAQMKSDLIKRFLSQRALKFQAKDV